jgi:hypothetical protein
MKSKVNIKRLDPEKYKNAIIAITYRKELDALIEEFGSTSSALSHLLDHINNNPKVSIEEAKEFIRKYTIEKFQSFNNEEINEYLLGCVKLSDEMAHEFLELVNNLGEHADFKSMFEDLLLKYAPVTSEPDDGYVKLVDYARENGFRNYDLIEAVRTGKIDGMLSGDVWLLSNDDYNLDQISKILTKMPNTDQDRSHGNIRSTNSLGNLNFKSKQWVNYKKTGIALAVILLSVIVMAVYFSDTARFKRSDIGKAIIACSDNVDDIHFKKGETKSGKGIVLANIAKDSETISLGFELGKNDRFKLLAAKYNNKDTNPLELAIFFELNCGEQISKIVLPGAYQALDAYNFIRGLGF